MTRRCRVLDKSLDGTTRKGRFWPYIGDREHPAVVFDFTPTRERAGPEKFLDEYRGYLQADAYVVYDSFFTDPERGLVEVGCWSHARRHFYDALENDSARMGAVLAYIAKLYAVEKTGRDAGIVGDALRLLRQQGAAPVLAELHAYREDSRASVAQKRRWPGGELCAEELAGADPLLRRRRPADRQQPHGTVVARHSRGPQQLAVCGQRPGRPDDGDSAELCGVVRVGEGGSVCLVPGRSVADWGAVDAGAGGVDAYRWAAAREAGR